MLDPGVLRSPEAKVEAAIGGPAVLKAKETPTGSVGKMAVLSTLPEIQRCMREMYSCAGTSTGSFFEFSHVKE